MSNPNYRPRYTDKSGVTVLETPFPTIKKAWGRCQELVHMGVAQVGSIIVSASTGETYTIAEIEKILADNEIPFDPIA
jgi:hypothetical protein